MKRLHLNRLHEKVVLAAIILSCGLVLQAEPPAAKTKGKTAPAVTHRTESGHAAATRAQQIKEAKAERVRYHVETR